MRRSMNPRFNGLNSYSRPSPLRVGLMNTGVIPAKNVKQSQRCIQNNGAIILPVPSKRIESTSDE